MEKKLESAKNAEMLLNNMNLKEEFEKKYNKRTKTVFECSI
jgi:hypothetical protein